MGLNPWQLLVWIAGLELISAPLLIFVINSAFVGWFRAKEQHQAKTLNALGSVIEEVGNKIEKRLKGEETK
jgi:hypothetical protein